MDTTHPLPPGSLEERMIALETRSAFQDDLLNTLNEQVSHQQIMLRELWDANRLLQDQLRNIQPADGEQGGTDNEPPPPHY